MEKPGPGGEVRQGECLIAAGQRRSAPAIGQIGALCKTDARPWQDVAIRNCEVGAAAIAASTPLARGLQQEMERRVNLEQCTTREDHQIYMRSIRLTVAVMMAALAVGVVGASAASASTGELVNSSGNELAKKTVTLKGGAQKLETIAKVSVKCTSGTGSAKLKGKTEAGESTLTLKGCTASTGGTCKTKGGVAETIEFKGLEDKIVTNVAGTEDLLLTTLGTAVEFECKEVKEVVKAGGQFLATATPQNTLATVFTLTAKQKEGVQEITKYKLGGVEKTATSLEANLGNTGFKQAGQEGVAEATLEEQGKLI